MKPKWLGLIWIVAFLVIAALPAIYSFPLFHTIQLRPANASLSVGCIFLLKERR